MKNCIFWTLFLLIVNPILSAEQQPSNPTLVFFIDHQSDESEDFVQITLQIEAKDTSLTTAINTAALTVQQISALAKNFCNQNTNKKAECKEIVETGKFEIQPRYQLIRKEPVFMGFTVTHEMTIQIKSVQKIGYLVDKILTKKGITLKNFEWKSLEESKTHEQAIAQGMQEGEGLCKQLGLKLGRVISIEQVNEQQAEEQKEDEQEEGGEEQQEEEEEQEDKTVFRFQVECAEAKKEKNQ